MSKYDVKMPGKPSAEIRKTIDLTTSIVGLRVVGSVGAGLPGLPGTIVMGGALPIAATGTLELAGRDYRRKKK